jgi:hypothetical protein
MLIDIYRFYKDNIGIAISPISMVDIDPYFKVYNSHDFDKANKVVNLKMNKAEPYLKPNCANRNNKNLWILSTDEREHLIEILNKPSIYFDNATNWDILKFEWNRNILHCSINLTKYLSGEYDDYFGTIGIFMQSYDPIPNYKFMKY